MSQDDDVLGGAIRRARKAAGMTQVALAKAIGVSRQTVAGWEAGRYYPQRRLMVQLTATLDLHRYASADLGAVLDRLMGHRTANLATRKLTWIELAREELGPGYSDAVLDAILWEETGFPCYWPDRDKTPEENCRQQLREFAATHPSVAGHFDPCNR